MLTDGVKFGTLSVPEIGSVVGEIAAIGEKVVGAA